MIRRTKQQKMKAQERRTQQLQYSFQAPETLGAATQDQIFSPPIPTKKEDLFGYDIRLIFRDLRKTLVVTVVILVCLIGIFIYTHNT